MFLDPHAKIDIFKRSLPHWRQAGVRYFVTFRLADSVPQEKLQAWKIQRNDFINNHPKPWNNSDTQKFHEQFTNKIEEWLDTGMGTCVLADDKVSKIVADCMSHFEAIRYHLGQWVIMPNHIHVVVSPRPGFELENILHSWKSFSSNEINKYLKLQGRLWQDESYNQIIRNEMHQYRIDEYIRNNPAKAGIRVHYASFL